MAPATGRGIRPVGRDDAAIDVRYIPPEFR